MKNIVILGAGFGGIRAALDLDRALSRDSSLRSGSAQNDSGGWRVVLVDRNAYHVYYPKLYDTAIPDSARHTDEVKKSSIPISEILQGTVVEFLQGDVKGIDCKKQQIVISTKRPDGAQCLPAGRQGEISFASSKEGVRSFAAAQDDETLLVNYEYLVFALGAGTDYFGIPGLQEYACTLKSLKDAEVIRDIVGEFLEKKRSRLDVVIGGAGATGVEVASELAYLLRTIPRDRWSITIVEALPRVLSMFPNGMSQYAHTRLEKLGVKLMLDTCIKSVEKISSSRPKRSEVERSHTVQDVRSLDSARDDELCGVEVVLAPRPLKPNEKESELVCDFLPEREKRITVDFLLWAGGVRANPLLASCGMAVDRKGRLEVDTYFQVKGIERVFAIGDNAVLVDPQTKQPVPATAQAAVLEGKIVANNIARAVYGTALIPYYFPKYHAVIPLADHDAVALMGDRVIRGFPAWALRKAADCRYYGTVVGWWKAVKRCIL